MLSLSLSLSLSLCFSVCIYVSLSLCQSVGQSVSQSVCLSVCLCLPPPPPPHTHKQTNKQSNNNNNQKRQKTQQMSSKISPWIGLVIHGTFRMEGPWLCVRYYYAKHRRNVIVQKKLDQLCRLPANCSVMRQVQRRALQWHRGCELAFVDPLPCQALPVGKWTGHIAQLLLFSGDNDWTRIREVSISFQSSAFKVP